MGYLTPNSFPDTTVCWQLEIPADFLLQTAVFGALNTLSQHWNWEEFGELTPEETAVMWAAVYDDIVESQGACTVLTGAIVSFFTEDPPDGYLLCDGTTYDKDDYPDLWDLIVNTFRTASEFTVPDLQGFIVRGLEDADNAGDIVGEDEITLLTGQLPAHTHTTTAFIMGADLKGEIPGLSLQTFGSTVTGSTGDADHVDVRQNSLQMNYYIKT